MKYKLIQGVSIVLEGNECSGKTTLSKRLVDYFNQNEIPAVYIKEPGGLDIAEKIRNLILYNDMPKLTELLLFNASRSVNMEEVVMPALKEGKLLIFDRFTTSTEVYQGMVNGNDSKIVNELTDIVVGKDFFTYPFYQILLDCSTETIMERLNNKNVEHNKYDKVDDRLIKVSEAYRKVFNNLDKRDNIIIDANRSFEDVYNESIAWIMNKIVRWMTVV